MNSKRGQVLGKMTKELVVEKESENKIVDNSSYALRVENLSKIYDSAAGRVVALDNVSFAIKKGEFVSVVGPSGSGKSTVLNMVGALDRPTSGKIYIDGIDIFSLSDSRELEVLQLLAAGASNQEIALALVVTPGTVKLHVNHILSKLGVHS